MSSTSINTNYQRPPPYICIPTAEDNTPEKGYLLIQTHTIPILFLIFTMNGKQNIQISPQYTTAKLINTFYLVGM